eukprot:5685926-Amphidinium_carterae.1
MGQNGRLWCERKLTEEAEPYLLQMGIAFHSCAPAGLLRIAGPRAGLRRCQKSKPGGNKLEFVH